MDVGLRNQTLKPHGLVNVGRELCRLCAEKGVQGFDVSETDNFKALSKALFGVSLGLFHLAPKPDVSQVVVGSSLSSILPCGRSVGREA